MQQTSLYSTKARNSPFIYKSSSSGHFDNIRNIAFLFIGNYFPFFRLQGFLFVQNSIEVAINKPAASTESAAVCVFWLGKGTSYQSAVGVRGANPAPRRASLGNVGAYAQQAIHALGRSEAGPDWLNGNLR